MPQRPTDVFIVGAGPTGLLLALVLARLGVSVRVVDKTAGPGTTSRALAVQARTLELYHQLDLADEAIRRGLVLDGVNLWRRGERAARVELGDIGKGESPYPFGLIFPQDEHEKLLIERLEALGVSVARNTEITALEEGTDRVLVHERAANGSTASTTEAFYVAGCDGARSTTREAIGVGFPGGTYEHLFYVADVEASGPAANRELHILLDHAGFLGVFPLAGLGRIRLVGTIQDAASGKGQAIEWEDVDRRPVDLIGLDVMRVNWFSTYHVHHRVADAFRRGRIFLLGDAAHVHSPVGGQGMNTGLGDAMNLGWKLEAVLHDRANPDVLDTYEPERIAFARRLVATTDRVFQAASSHGKVAEVIRANVVPWILPRLARTKEGRHLFFRILSQIGVAYRQSAWSTGRKGKVHAGDRLPWVEHARNGADDNFAPLRALDWQAHVFREPSSDLRSLSAERGVTVVSFPMNDRAHRAGFEEDGVYLVRPDGYLGGVFAGGSSVLDLRGYLDVHGIRGRA
jgi:2-polyprenyl-6-methoxyphenol hydroxylase-like FAD-dependent oxidoreductase